MKQFRLVYTQAAVQDLYEAYTYIRSESPRNAAIWRAKLMSAANSLRSSPGRCSLAPENSLTTEEIRQLIFGNYRVLFTIDGESVVILHFRHAAREPMSLDELFPPDSN